MIHSQVLNHFNILELDFPLENKISSALKNEDWNFLDKYFENLGKPQQRLHQFLLAHANFNQIEHLISIREAPTDEEGIWHDDGSRLLGFSLSLNENPDEISGGNLFFRKKGEENFLTFSPRPFGKILLFKTGVYGYEHKVSAVTKGKRIVIAGWCS